MMVQRVILVPGATGKTGQAFIKQAQAAGNITIGFTRDSIVADEHPNNFIRCDITDFRETEIIINQIFKTYGHIDGIVHLIGGWRGGKTFTDNSPADWEVLSQALLTTLRHVTLAAQPYLLDSQCARVISVSASAAQHPTAGNANYATVKMASQSWLAALADSFSTSQPELRAAATTLLVKAIDTKAGDTKPGFVTPETLAATILAQFDVPAQSINGKLISVG